MIIKTHQQRGEDILRVLGLGDSVVDKHMYICTMYLGRNVLNFAVYAKVFGMEAGYLGVFGGDEVAVHVYDTIRGLGPELSHCRFYPGGNGYAGVRLDDGDGVLVGPNRGGVSRGHPLELTIIDRACIAGYDIVHTSVFSYTEDELSSIRQTPSFVSMSFSDRVGEEYLRQCAPYVNCVSISCGNMPRSETEKQMTLIRKFGCRHIIIVTRGTRGALVMADGRLYEQSPCLVEAVDTVGAEDSFITCLLINYADVVKDSRDFPSASGTKRTVTAAGYQDLAVRTSLYCAAAYLTSNCQKEGSLGFGRVFQYEQSIM